jgi:hypothetical protein
MSDKNTGGVKPGPGRPPNPFAKMRRDAQDRFDQMTAGVADQLFDRLYRIACDDNHDGQLSAIKMLVDRVAPVRTKSLFKIYLPALSTPTDVDNAMAAIIAQVAAGELPSDEGQRLVGMLESKLKAFEATVLPARVEELRELALAAKKDAA